MLHLAWLRHNKIPKCHRIFVLTLYNKFFHRSQVRNAGYQGHAVHTDKKVQDPARQHPNLSGLQDSAGIKNGNENETGT